MFDLHQDKTHARQTLTIDNQLNQNDKQIDEKYRKIGSSCGSFHVITHKDNSNRKHRFNSVQQNIQMQMQNQQNSHKSWF